MGPVAVFYSCSRVTGSFRKQRTTAYERQNWSLDEAGWEDSECVAYLRFSRAEIRSLIQEFKLVVVWVDSRRDQKYARVPEQIYLIMIAICSRLKKNLILA